MNNKIVGLGTLLASAGLVLAAPAYAHFAKEQKAEKKAGKPQFTISSQARKAIVDLQTAVNAKDTANIPAKLAEAESKAKTGDDKYIIAQLRLKAAADSNDMPAAGQAIEAILASGVTPEADKIKYYNNLGQIHYAA